MENNISFIERDFSTEEGLKIGFLYEKANHPDWPKCLYYSRAAILLGRTPPIKQGSMTDFDYFKALYKEDKKVDSLKKTYYMMEDNLPKGIYIIENNALGNEITYQTAKTERGKGYATRGLNLFVQNLFNDPHLESVCLNIIEIEAIGASEKVALANGFIYDERTGLYIKHNPNYIPTIDNPNIKNK